MARRPIPASRSRTRSCQIDSKPIDDSRDLARKIADLPANTDGRREGVAQQGRADGQGQARHVPEPAEAAEGTTEPEEPKDLGGNVDLKQLGLSVKQGAGKDGVADHRRRSDSDAARRASRRATSSSRSAARRLPRRSDVAKAVKKAQDEGAPGRPVAHQAQRRPDGAGGRSRSRRAEPGSRGLKSWRRAPSCRECGPPRRSD